MSFIIFVRFLFYVFYLTGYGFFVIISTLSLTKHTFQKEW